MVNNKHQHYTSTTQPIRCPTTHNVSDEGGGRETPHYAVTYHSTHAPPKVFSVYTQIVWNNVLVANLVDTYSRYTQLYVTVVTVKVSVHTNHSSNERDEHHWQDPEP